jgi:hypothetical protein
VVASNGDVGNNNKAARFHSNRGFGLKYFGTCLHETFLRAWAKRVSVNIRRRAAGQTTADGPWDRGSSYLRQ